MPIHFPSPGRMQCWQSGSGHLYCQLKKEQHLKKPGGVQLYKSLLPHYKTAANTIFRYGDINYTLLQHNAWPAQHLHGRLHLRKANRYARLQQHRGIPLHQTHTPQNGTVFFGQHLVPESTLQTFLKHHMMLPIQPMNTTGMQHAQGGARSQSARRRTHKVGNYRVKRKAAPIAAGGLRRR